MKKLFSLIKVSLSQDMNIFKINSKKASKATKVLLPLVLTVYLAGLMGFYSSGLIDLLAPAHLEYVALTLFTLAVSIISLIEGVYKSGPLLFKCKDDDMLLSLPLEKKTILFIRIFKFYTFELLYNSLFIIPSMVIYAIKMNPSWSYYLVSGLAVLLLPIVPIVLSCLMGFFVTYISSKFKGKNFIQTIFTFAFVFLIMYISYSSNTFINSIAENAKMLNDKINSLYYPVGAYISLINNFDIIKLLIYVGIHLLLLAITILVLGKVYFKINSSNKSVSVSHKVNGKYTIKRNSKMVSFVKKELNKFVSTPVFITNAGFGLLLFIVACIAISLKYDSIITGLINKDSNITKEAIQVYLPLAAFSLISFTSFMTCITSSMISLEGKSFNILKSLPVKAEKIVLYKVIASLVLMIPCILIGDLILFIRFKFDILSIVLLLIISILFPFFNELIGILINLKYPKVDATNDTEVVKQSMSSFISTFLGMTIACISIGGAVIITLFTNIYIAMLSFIVLYGLITYLLWLSLKKNGEKKFNDIMC